MANPARVHRMLLGVADPSLAERMLGVLHANGVTRALVVHGDDGLDELTTTSRSTVWELDAGDVRRWTLDPVAHGFSSALPGELVGGDPATNAEFARAVLAGKRGPHRDIVVLNAAAGLVVGGAAATVDEGATLAAAAIDDGRAAAALDRLVEASQAAMA
jgi:anthranilate phosphoribosyltransferase